MNTYLFITYGEAGWRGVQMRGVRIAKSLPRKEVLFWNLYDSELLEKEGFRVISQESGLHNPRDIVFPKGTKVVVFADLPSNEFFLYSVYQAALLQKKRIVICDQLYRRGQTKEGVYKRFAEEVDLMLLNSLSFFKDEETDTIKIIPPQIELQFTPETTTDIRVKYNIPKESLLIFGAGYHEKVYEKIRLLLGKLQTKGYPFHAVISGSGTETKKTEGNITVLPFTSGDEYFKLLYASDIVLIKFGFLQLLEALVLHNPTIVLGEAGHVLKNKQVLDKVLLDAAFFSEEIDEEAYRHLEQLLIDPVYRQKIVRRVKKLHNGELEGGRLAAEAIQALASRKATKKVVRKKKLAILVNNEIFEQQSWLEKQTDTYPICFITPMGTEKEIIKRFPEGMLQRPIQNLQIEQADEILPHSFKHVFTFSRRKYDGFLDIFPWFENWIDQLQQLLHTADTIYLTPQGEKIIGPLLKKKSLQKKIVKLKPVL